jgi:hypothetical protein
MNKTKYLSNSKRSLSLLAISMLFSFPFSVYAQTPTVSYGGIYTPLGNSKTSFINFNRNKKKIVSGFKSIIEKLNEENKLSFQIALETDVEESKKQIENNNYSIAFVITRDDISSETFSLPEATINKTFVNVGMVAVIYQTIEEEGKQKNSIVYSLPIVGYSMNLKENNSFSEEELDQNFVNVATKTLEEEIVKKLEKISLSEIKGFIQEIKGDKYLINLGTYDGLNKGSIVRIYNSKNERIEGVVESVEKNTSWVTSEKILELANEVKATSLKGLSNETYQVLDFKISSEKCRKWFDEKTIGAQASQWFSDFLSERGGKVVFPSMVGSNWVSISNEKSSAIFIKDDGSSYEFEIAKPKYTINLDLTGLADQKVEEESNSVNELWVYKLWFNVEIPEKKYSNEFSMETVKRVIPQAQAFDQKNEIFDLLHQLTAKSAKEIE